MIRGKISDQGLPIIDIPLRGSRWDAIIDTGFNGDLELPAALSLSLSMTYLGSVDVQLGGGQSIEEEIYLIDFPFDGEIVAAEVTFSVTDEILIGTQMFRSFRLEIDFVAKTVVLEKPGT